MLAGTHYATGDGLDRPLCGAEDFAMLSCGEHLVSCPDCRRIMDWPELPLLPRIGRFMHADHPHSTTAICSTCWKAVEDAAEADDKEALVEAVAQLLRHRGWT
jgi:hypothetical protein